MLIELLTKHYPGMRQWLAQRLSAAYMALYLVLLLLLLAIKQPANYDAWQLFFAPIWWRVLSVLFFVALLMHAWLGIRDVLKDYVPHLTLRNMLQLLVDIALIAYFVWFLLILW